MTTLAEARKALLELEQDAIRFDDDYALKSINVIKDYLKTQELAAHVPGQPLTGEQFHKLYGAKNA